jgi:hypothetical protein
MTLDDLNWLPYGGSIHGEWEAVAHMPRCRIYRQRRGLYDIITDGGADMQWYDIGALTAQAVLNHLTIESAEG